MQVEQQASVLVIGMGLTGVSCARYFAARNRSVLFADSRLQPPGLDEVQSLLPDAAITIGKLPQSLPEGVEQIVVSPGVQAPQSLLDEAAANGVSVVSDIDLYLAEEAASVLLVTGSNGKSTVTSLVNHILNQCGINSVAGGNIGVPVLDLLGQAHDTAVLELSSFQLERSALPLSEVAVILNLAVDHIDQHGSFAAYRDAKMRIYERCKVAILNRDQEELAELIPADKPILSFGLDVPEEGQWGVEDGHIVCGKTQVLAVADVPLTGEHNLANVLAAFAICHASGVALGALGDAVAGFVALPHRMQTVPSTDNIVWINDSKATNEAAAVASIRSVSDPLVLIAGGDGKGTDFQELAAALRGRDVCALVYGKDAVELQGVLAPVCAVSRTDSLESAVRDAAGFARPGCTVLLAPACSSLDMFKNFAERGECFIRAVTELQS